MLRAIAVIGSDNILNSLVKSFKKNEIYLDEKDYTFEDVIDLLKEDVNKEIDIILAAEDVIEGNTGGKKLFIQKIRELDEDVRVGIFASNCQTDQEFINWAFGYRVYDIYYPDKSQSFMIGSIINDIKLGRLSSINKKANKEEEENSNISKLVSIFKPAKQGKTKEEDEKKEKHKSKEKKLQEEKAPKHLEKIVEKIVEKEVIKEVPIEVEVPVVVEKVVEKIIEKPVERIVEKIVEKPVMMPYQPSAPAFAGTFFVGIMNLNNGAGATTNCVGLAEELADLGYKVAVVPVDGKDHLTVIEGKSDYLLPERSWQLEAVLEHLSETFCLYDFVIMDFGTIFDLTPSGKLASQNLVTNRLLISEFLRCNHHFVCGSALPWHIDKINYFLKDKGWLKRIKGSDYTFIYDSKEKLKELGTLNIRGITEEQSLAIALPIGLTKNNKVL